MFKPFLEAVFSDVNLVTGAAISISTITSDLATFNHFCASIENIVHVATGSAAFSYTVYKFFNSKQK